MMTEYIFNIIGIAILGNMIAHWFLPIQGAKRSFIGGLSTISAFLYTLTDKVLNCSKCMSFWLYITFQVGNLFSDLFLLPEILISAALCSYIGYLINFSIDKIENWYE
jgi:fluoride ion exporter CrcB/FEX